MKLVLSNAEAQATIRRAFNLPSEVEVIFGKKKKRIIKSKDDFGGISTALAKLIIFIDGHVTTNKIGAIKELRTFVDPSHVASLHTSSTYIGLKEAKDIIENWQVARPFFFSLKRIPMLRYTANGQMEFN